MKRVVSIASKIGMVLFILESSVYADVIAPPSPTMGGIIGKLMGLLVVAAIIYAVVFFVGNKDTIDNSETNEAPSYGASEEKNPNNVSEETKEESNTDESNQ